MQKPKKVNTNTLTKLCKDFLKQHKNGGENDTSLAIHSFPQGEGSIVFRMKINSNDTVVGTFIYRYTNEHKKVRKISLGKFDPETYPFSKATEDTALYRKQIKQGIDPLAVNLSHTPEKRLATFKDVVHFYIYYQTQSGKKDRDNVKRELTKNVLGVKKFEPILDTLAHEVTEDCIEKIVSHMVKRDIGRSSNRVKTYLTTAYNFAKKRQATLGALREKGFPDVDFSRIRYNPAQDVATDPSFEQSKNNHLTEKKLTQFYQSVTLDKDDSTRFCMETSTFYLITLNILLGGHRKRQLIDVDWGRVDFEERSIEIIDYKGNSGKPREYLVYLSDTAIECLKRLRELSGGVGKIYPFSESYIPKQFRLYSTWAKTSVKYDGLRSTCTTLMKKHFKKVIKNYDPDDVKRIQHHVFSGVQSKHYDKNEYWEEKTALLTEWEQYLKQLGLWV
ncbi:tyrosine-type recombinase/integrase [Endozoicomonas ascidiicola]|uniref:tyrosine-type recombinase/integrase n=1 Tax=Endozoicomonas ascidiicola TaxID=1698521 RepID=UPI00083349A2|nr:hypothetical protein [Endozoicomonas ascidiicola]